MVSLTVQADPNSYVGIAAVDKSVLLLGQANDITANRVSLQYLSMDTIMYQPKIFHFSCMNKKVPFHKTKFVYVQNKTLNQKNINIA